MCIGDVFGALNVAHVRVRECVGAIWEGHQTSPYSMCERLECSRCSHSRAVVHDKALRRRKISLIFREFFQNSGKKGEMDIDWSH